jgi:hypothetical protein
LRPKLVSEIAIAILLVIVGQVKAEDDQLVLTVSDIALAFGMNWWVVRFPADMEEHDTVGLAYKHPDGSIERGNGFSGLRLAGTTAKVIVWESEDGEQLRYALIGDAIRAKASLPSKAEMKEGSRLVLSQGMTVDAGTVLMKIGRSTIGFHDVQPGEIGLILHVTKGD